MEANARGIVKSSTLISGWGKRMEAGTHSPMKYVRFWREKPYIQFLDIMRVCTFSRWRCKKAAGYKRSDPGKNFEVIRGWGPYDRPRAVSYSIGIQVWYLHFISIQYYPFNNQCPSDIFHNVHAIQNVSGLIWCIHNHIISTPQQWRDHQVHLMKAVKVPQSCLTLLTPWTIAHQVPLSLGFSRPEYGSGLPSLLQGIFLTQESTWDSHIAGNFFFFFTVWTTREALLWRLSGGNFRKFAPEWIGSS